MELLCLSKGCSGTEGLQLGWGWAGVAVQTSTHSYDHIGTALPHSMVELKSGQIFCLLESHETMLKQVSQKPATFQAPRHGAA